MRVLLDTNVLLDVLLNRSLWVADSSLVWQASDDGKIVGYITSTTLTDIFYVSRKLKGIETARIAVRICLEAFQISTVDRDVLERAEKLPGDDFEDNLQIACAERSSLDAIVTRDKSGFDASSIWVLSPADLIAALA